MALVKDIELGTGVITSYHKIGTLNIDRITNQVRIEVFSYLSKEARNDNRSPIQMRTIYAQAEAPMGELLAYLYRVIKSNAEFAGSGDDLESPKLLETEQQDK